MAFSFSFVKSKATIIQIIMNETKEAAPKKPKPKPKPNPKKGKKANRRSRQVRYVWTCN